MNGVYLTEAVVGLEKISYMYKESKVCTIVYSPNLPCPIEHPFNVSFSSDANSAGKLMCNIVHT